MDWSSLYRRHRDHLEDFWNRKGNAPTLHAHYRIFGAEVAVAANHRCAAEALELSLPLFSTVADSGTAESLRFELQFAVDGRLKADAVPEDLSRHIHRMGEAEWLLISAAEWGTAHVDLRAGAARIALSPQLAARPELISGHLLNTILLNLFIGSGRVGMLHASCLLREGRGLLLLAPHNTGKSTTAWRLIQEGYQLLTDSMVFVSGPSAGRQLMGFPVGRIKLRTDSMREAVTVDASLADLFEAEQVRSETKHSLDLRQCDPSRVVDQAVPIPEHLDLCLMSRSGRSQTELRPAMADEVAEAIMANSLYFDTETVWSRNLELIGDLVDNAVCHHLEAGTDAKGLVKALEQLGAKR